MAIALLALMVTLSCVANPVLSATDLQPAPGPDISRIVAVNNTVNILRRDFEELKTKTANDSSALQSAVSELQDELEDLRNKTVNMIAGETSALNSTVNSLNTKVNALNIRADTNSNNISALRSALDAVKNELQTTTANIYFLTTITETVVNVAKGIVIFNKVLVNIGSGYNSASGVFTAPRRGLYLFTVQSLSYAKGTQDWDLYVNGAMVLRSTLNVDIDASHSYVYPTLLEPGDRVWVYSRQTIFRAYGYLHSFFGGLLIKAL